MKMNGNTELLNFIYQNSQMGVKTIDNLINVTDNENFKKHMEYQHNEYGKINTRAKELLNKNGLEEKEISKFDRIKTKIMMEFETVKDNSVCHIAEMLIIGSNMGVINAIKNLKKYPNAEKEITDLMTELKVLEESNAKELQNYL